MSDNLKNTSGLRNLATILMERMGLASLMGTRFQGQRDYYKTFGYESQITFEHMHQKYLRQGLAARVVDAPAQGLWHTPPTIVSNDKEWNDAWNRLVNKHGLWETILRLDKLAGIGRYACLHIAVQGLTDTKRDVTRHRTTYKNKLVEVVHMQVYSQPTAKIQEWEDDPTSPQYMRPRKYTIMGFQERKGSMEDTLPSQALKRVPINEVHWSQILHLAENCLENPVYGSPRLERVFNDLDDLLKVTGGSAEAFWLTANRGMQLDVDKEMELTPEDAKDLSDEIEEFQNQLRRVIRTRGVKINNLGADVSSPKDTYEVIVSNISGGTGIPRRILIGTEAGQLASEQDRANWAERVEGRRVEFGTPNVIFPLLALLTRLSVLPSPENLTVSVIWPDAYKLSPLEYAQQSAQHARSAVNFARVVEIFENMRIARTTSAPAEDGTQDFGGGVTPGAAQDNDNDGRRDRALFRQAVQEALKEERSNTSDDGLGGKDLDKIDMSDVQFITIDEIRTFLGLGEMPPQLDDPGDLQHAEE